MWLMNKYEININQKNLLKICGKLLGKHALENTMNSSKLVTIRICKHHLQLIYYFSYINNFIKMVNPHGTHRLSCVNCLA